MWARLHRAPPFSPRPATPVSEVNCHGKRIEEATSSAFTCKQRPPHVSCHVGGIDSAEAEHPPSTIKSIYTATQLQQLECDVPKHHVRCHCENDTDAGICTSSSPDGRWSSGVGDRFCHAIPGQWTSLMSQAMPCHHRCEVPESPRLGCIARRCPQCASVLWSIDRKGYNHTKVGNNTQERYNHTRVRYNHTNLGYNHTHIRHTHTLGAEL